MKTLRLYYDNAYLTEFSGIVVHAEGNRVALNQSAFYPTSGGQPNDLGTLTFEGTAINVTDVTVEDDIVWHHLDRPIPEGAQVLGQIQWDRRFDHMQQHAGDHMIAGAVWQLFGGVTIGLHTGQEESTIDITMPEGKTHLTDEETALVEALVNRRIQHNAPIRCWFPDDKELSSLPIRKKPTVNEHIRIVAMGDYEMVACGGTHPSTTGQIGPVKILSTAPSRGNMRLTFLAGMRAAEHYQACHRCVREIGTLLSADVHTAPATLEKLIQANAAQVKDVQSLLSEATLHMIRMSKHIRDGKFIYACHLPFADAAAMQQAAKELIAEENTLLLLSCRRDGGRMLLFARSRDVDVDMAALLRKTGARGGGKPDFAQGSTTEETVLDAALSLL